MRKLLGITCRFVSLETIVVVNKSDIQDEDQEDEIFCR